MLTTSKKNSLDNRRYKLHQQIKDRFEYYARRRLVIIPYDYNLNDPFLAELRDRFRYNIQYSIISLNEIEVQQFEIL